MLSWFFLHRLHASSLTKRLGHISLSPGSVFSLPFKVESNIQVWSNKAVRCPKIRRSWLTLLALFNFPVHNLVKHWELQHQKSVLFSIRWRDGMILWLLSWDLHAWIYLVMSIWRKMHIHNVCFARISWYLFLQAKFQTISVFQEQNTKLNELHNFCSQQCSAKEKLISQMIPTGA